MKKTRVLNQLSGIQRVALVTAGMLLIPVLGRFPWGVLDFVIMGILIFGTGMVLDWISRNVEIKYRVYVAAAVILGFLIIWAELAVGLVSQLLTGELWIYDYVRMYL